MRQSSLVRGVRTTSLCANTTNSEPLRRSQLARRDHVPDPLPVAKIKRPWFLPVARVARWTILLGSIVIIVAAMWAGVRWIDLASSHGALYAHNPVAEAQQTQFFELPALPESWHWVMLPVPLGTDKYGRPSYWVAVRKKGIQSVQSKNDLPPTGQLGDQYHVNADGTNWVWMTPFGAQAASWVDP
jgi:hypothetical protein